MTGFILLGVAWIINHWTPDFLSVNGGVANWVATPEPLVMKGGDPYIRALMRTISASESNVDAPYHVLFGGKIVADLSQHPDLCVPITVGPNRGDCTTAAGRYQFLTTTWQEKAHHYHPDPPSWYHVWGTYSFDPEAQDIVVYNWLNDTSAWGLNISSMLQQGRLEEVLAMLSGTWTSLGYGIETNSMSAHLPDIYVEMLHQEINGG